MRHRDWRRPMKLVVIGGSGFVGSHLIKRASDIGHDVINLDIVPLQGDPLPNVRFVRADITNQAVMSSLFNKDLKDIDVVIHLAALSREAESLSRAEEYFAVNVQGTFNLLRAVVNSNATKLIFASSYLVYGNPQYLPVDELHPLNPRSFYATTKVEGEILCNSFKRLYGLDTTTLRKSIVYGRGDTSKRVIMLFIERALRGDAITIFGDKRLDFVHVDDVVDAYIACATHRGESVFNLGSGHGTPLLELAETIKTSINPKITIRRENARENEVSEFVADITKITKAMNFRPGRSLVDFIGGMKNGR